MHILCCSICDWFVLISKETGNGSSLRRCCCWMGFRCEEVSPSEWAGRKRPSGAATLPFAINCCGALFGFQPFFNLFRPIGNPCFDIMVLNWPKIIKKRPLRRPQEISFCRELEDSQFLSLFAFASQPPKRPFAHFSSYVPCA